MDAAGRGGYLPHRHLTRASTQDRAAHALVRAGLTRSPQDSRSPRLANLRADSPLHISVWRL